MSSKRTMIECTVKRSKNNRWNVSVSKDKLGQVDSLTQVTDLLYENGYKVYAYQRRPSASGKHGFVANCLKFNPKKEDV